MTTDAAGKLLPQLVAEWRQEARPLLLFDEVRVPASERALGEFVSFVFLVTDTRTAATYADDVSILRDQLSPADASALIKGRNLYGNGRRAVHNDLRGRIRTAVQNCPGVARFTTCSSVLKRYEAIAPGGIRAVSEAGESMAPIRGRELVSFMTMVKLVANAYQLGAVQVDVLLDRSAQLGLDPNLLGRSEDEWYLLGPGELNTQADGSPASLFCPSRFLFIAPTKRGPFRDLALLPDSLAYVMMRRRDLEAAQARVAGGESFVMELASGAAVANDLGL